MTDKAKENDVKTANQAWRKKPRKFAPKSRLGCKTCKIRRIKCDLSQPSCSKCQSTGRTCDGYGDIPVAVTSKMESSNRAIGCHDADFTILHTLKPFMVLPVATSTQTDALSFFQTISIHNLNQYQPGDAWQQTLMYFAQTVPSVRHAAIALGLMHRTCLDRELADNSYHAQDEGPDKDALTHYNKAIRLVLGQGGVGGDGNDGDDDGERKAVTLLVCLLFTCFDHLAGNDVQAMAHLRGGVELARAIEYSDEGVCGDARPWGVRRLIGQVTRQIRRLDLQAATFLLDWTPAGMQNSLDEPEMPVHHSGAFESLGQAADDLQPLVARIMMLRNTTQKLHPIEEIPSSRSSLKNNILVQLDTWSTLFEAMLAHNHHHHHHDCTQETEMKTHRLVSLLRLQHNIAWILLSAYGPGNEMEYDRFLPCFQKCVALADDIASGHGQSLQSSSSFTPDLGVVPVLYIIGVKCRHPDVRRDVVRILKRKIIREALWHSGTAARIVGRVWAIEEGGGGWLGEEESGKVGVMEDIMPWQRVEDISWMQVGGGQLDLQYTFCGREGVYTESLVV